MDDQQLKEELDSINFKLSQLANFMDEAARSGDYEEIKDLAASFIDLCDHAMHYKEKYGKQR